MMFIAKMLELKNLQRIFYQSSPTRRLLITCDGDTESALETLCNLLGFSMHMVSLFMFTMLRHVAMLLHVTLPYIEWLNFQHLMNEKFEKRR